MHSFVRSMTQIYANLDRWRLQLQGTFAAKVSVVFVYSGLSYALIALCLVLAARTWGPAEYGNVTLTASIGALLYFPMSLGVQNAMYRFLPLAEASERPRWMVAALVGQSASLILFVVLYLLMYPFIAAPLRISSHIWHTAIVFTVTSNIMAFAEALLRGTNRFTLIGQLRLVSAVIFTILVLLVLYGFRFDNFAWYYYAYAAAHIPFVAVVLWLVQLSLRQFEWSMLKAIYVYGVFVMLNTLGTTVILNSDIIILNYFYPGESVGIYAAYQGFAKQIFFVLFHEIFAVVFLPTIATMDAEHVRTLLQKYSLMTFAGGITMTALLTTGMLLILGREYPLNGWYVLIVACATALFLVFQLYNSSLFMQGNEGAQRSLRAVITILPFALLGQGILTYALGVFGTFIALLITNGLLILRIRWAIRA